MKVVFSRKGVDSAAGQCASALIGDRPVSIPIPTTEHTPTTYGDLREEVRELANDLSGGELSGARLCHLDPDIDVSALACRPHGWRGALGQVSGSLSHLMNQSVGSGDLFLFWGKFCPVARVGDRWQYCGPPKQVIFGWLAVEEASDVGGDATNLLAQYPWLSGHPHAQPGWSGPNTVFVASHEIELDGRRFPGSGIFKRAYQLSEPDGPLPSVWSVPPWLDKTMGGVGLSYHSNEGRWLGDGRLQTVARGQEFVANINGRQDAESWLADLLEAHT